MKRFTFVALLCATALTLLSGVASARWSEPQNILWRRERTWNTGNSALMAPDTAWTTMAASKVDTSAMFNLLDADLPGSGAWGVTSTTNDTTAFAFLVIYSDSSVASTTVFAAATAEIQINWGTSAISWQSGKTYTCAMASGVKQWTIPIFVDPVQSTSSTSYGGVSPLGNQIGWQFAPSLRVITTGAATTAVTQARIKLIKYRGPGNQASGGTTNW